MTDGHKHRHIKVRRYGLMHVWLTTPRSHETDIDYVDASPYPYGKCPEHANCWYLSILSVLHKWTGLTLVTEESSSERRADPR